MDSIYSNISIMRQIFKVSKPSFNTWLSVIVILLLFFLFIVIFWNIKVDKKDQQLCNQAAELNAQIEQKDSNINKLCMDLVLRYRYSQDEQTKTTIEDINSLILEKNTLIQKYNKLMKESVFQDEFYTKRFNIDKMPLSYKLDDEIATCQVKTKSN